MVKEAENFAKGRPRKTGIPQTQRIKLTQFCTKLEETKRAGRQCSQLDKENVEAKVNEVMDAIFGGSTQAIKDAMDVLNQEIM